MFSLFKCGNVCPDWSNLKWTVKCRCEHTQDTLMMHWDPITHSEVVWATCGQSVLAVPMFPGPKLRADSELTSSEEKRGRQLITHCPQFGSLWWKSHVLGSFTCKRRLQMFVNTLSDSRNLQWYCSECSIPKLKTATENSKWFVPSYNSALNHIHWVVEFVEELNFVEEKI